MAQEFTYITTNSKSGKTVMVLGRHYSRRTAKKTGRRVVKLSYPYPTSGISTRSPVLGERLILHRDPGGIEYVLAPGTPLRSDPSRTY
jgi:hypothetical protein